MSAINFIKAVATKSLTGNRGSGIRSIPSAIEAEAKTGELLAILQKAGIPINQLDDYIRSEADVLKFLNIIEASSKPRVIPGSSAEGRAITEKLFGKKGEVVSFKDKIEAMKKSGDIVDVGDVKISKKITDREMFKNSNLNKPTIEGQMEKITGASNKIKEIQKEIDNMYKPKSDANQRLKGPIKEKQDMGPFGKVDVETDYSSSINRPEFFDPKAKNMFGKTVKTGVEFIQKEKERILNLINNKKKNMVPPTHSNYKLLKKSLQDQEDALEAIKITEDLGGNENMFDFLRTENISDYSSKPLKRSNYTKTDAEIKAEIEAGNKKGIESLKNKKDDPEDMATGGRAGFANGGTQFELPFGKPDYFTGSGKNRRGIYIQPDGTRLVVPIGPDDLPSYATGGRAGFDNGGISGLRSDPEVAKKINKILEDKLIKQQPEGVLMDPPPRPNYELIEEMLNPKDKGLLPNNTIEFDDGTIFFKDSGEYYKQDGTEVEGPSKGAKVKPITMEAATGGRAGFYTGGIVDVEPSLDDIGHGSDALMARTRLVSPGNQATTSTGLNYLLAEDNDNMRVPFGSGGSYDYGSMQYKIDSVMAAYKRYKKGSQTSGRGGKMTFEQFAPIWAKENFATGGRAGFAAGGGGRRAFLKLMATLGGGVAAAKSGILGLGGKEVGKQTAKEVVKSAGSGTPPPYFFKLVEKIKTLGDETIATQDKAIAKKYKDYVMEEDFAGNITIIKKGDENLMMRDGDVYMSYKVDEVPVKGKKGSTKVEEYEEFTARPDAEGKMKDVEPGVPDEVVQEGTMFEDNMTEFGMTKKATGGRIGFSAGSLAKLGITGSSRRFLEKVFGKERFATMIENDPRMHRGMLEVVEMFRNKDKEGLKKYMQKFLPDMDDATVEDFIIGGKGSEGIEGQLIRLGSGREYKNLINMKKEADQIRKLDDFDIDDVSKNAEGGRIGLFLGGGLTPGKSLLKNMLKFMAKDGSHKKSPAEVLKMMNPKQYEKLLNDPRYMGKVSSEAPEGLDKIIQDMIGKTKTERSDMVGDIISASRNIKKVDDDILNYKLKIIEDMVSKGIDREIAEEAAENISKEVAKSAGKKSTPKITEQGLLELENIQKNLVTKDRKLQATGGLTTMLGE